MKNFLSLCLLALALFAMPGSAAENDIGIANLEVSHDFFSEEVIATCDLLNFGTMPVQIPRVSLRIFSESGLQVYSNPNILSEGQFPEFLGFIDIGPRDYLRRQFIVPVEPGLFDFGNYAVIMTADYPEDPNAVNNIAVGQFCYGESVCITSPEPREIAARVRYLDSEGIETDVVSFYEEKGSIKIDLENVGTEPVNTYRTYIFLNVCNDVHSEPFLQELDSYYLLPGEVKEIVLGLGSTFEDFYDPSLIPNINSEDIEIGYKVDVSGVNQEILSPMGGHIELGIIE